MPGLTNKRWPNTAAVVFWTAVTVPLVATPLVVHAQNVPVACAAATAPYRFLRYLEDFGFLRDPACRTDYLDGVKYFPIGEDAKRFFTLGGDLRLQSINARYLSFGNEGGDNHNVALERLHLHANFRLSPDLRLFTELKSNHQQNREPRALVVDVDRLDLHQAFVDFGNDQSSQLRIGRQEIIYGSGRRIFPRNGPNVRGSLDAVRGMTQFKDLRLDAFAFRPVEVDAGVFDDSKINTQSCWGMYAVGAPPSLAPLKLDLYYIGAHRKGARFSQGAAVEHRHSIGSRLFGKSGAWDFDHEFTLQWGTFGSGNIRAWSITSESGYAWLAVPGRPRGSIRLTGGSGDRNPTDPDLQTFNAFSPRGGVVSDGFNISPANALHARAAIDFDITPTLRTTVALETLSRTSLRDGIYGPGGNLIRAPGGGSARHVGNDVDTTVTWTIDRHNTFALAAGKFVSGRFIKESGAPRNMSFVTATYQFRF